MKSPIMKKVLLVVFSLSLINISFGQNVYEYYRDGEIFFKLKDEIPVEIFEDGKVSLEYFQSLSDLKNDYKLFYLIQQKTYVLYILVHHKKMHDTFLL